MTTIVELPEEQVAALERFCRRAGITQAEAIREAVDKLISNGDSAEVAEDLLAGFGLWHGRFPDARTYVEDCRAEWAEREHKFEEGQGV